MHYGTLVVSICTSHGLFSPQTDQGFGRARPQRVINDEENILDAVDKGIPVLEDFLRTL